ncbi:hypothetical protein RRG08_061643 [Elysia crispata]|uniref:Uncharacterized protein n=1 Tax=Elysia crispata TaxID=231223 RepID=A0AAE1DRW2_9GAST|nr:hypothetical protein RRG08_061643 [Elysia crispata]
MPDQKEAPDGEPWSVLTQLLISHVSTQTGLVLGSNRRPKPCNIDNGWTSSHKMTRFDCSLDLAMCTSVSPQVSPRV